MSTPATVFEAFAAVQRDIEAIGKDKRVTEGPARFAFRGVDDVMNALHAPMAQHGLICVPQVQERVAEIRETAKGSRLNVIHLRVRFAFYGPDGSTFHAETWGEAQDSGDKATGKAHSMAYKSALLEAFHVPTEDIGDADYDTTPASAPTVDPVREVKNQIVVAGRALGLATPEEIRAHYAELHGGEDISAADLESLAAYLTALKENAA